MTDGRFAVGNAGGPGNPNAGKVYEIRQAFAGVCDFDTMERAAKKLLRIAFEEDPEKVSVKEQLTALAMMFDRRYGRATQPILLDVAEVDEHAALIEQKAEVLRTIIQQNPELIEAEYRELESRTLRL